MKDVDSCFLTRDPAGFLRGKSSFGRWTLSILDLGDEPSAPVADENISYSLAHGSQAGYFRTAVKQRFNNLAMVRIQSWMTTHNVLC